MNKFLSQKYTNNQIIIVCVCVFFFFPVFVHFRFDGSLMESLELYS